VVGRAEKAHVTYDKLGPQEQLEAITSHAPQKYPAKHNEVPLVVSKIIFGGHEVSGLTRLLGEL
jgi:hypothetical protein